MAQAKQEIFYKLIQPGQLICINVLGICNEGHLPAEEAQVEIHTPPGLILENYNLPRGVYDESTGIWTIGTLYPGEKFEGPKTPSFCYRVAEYTDAEGNPVDIETYEGLLEDLRSGDCFVPYNWYPMLSNGPCPDCNPHDDAYCITVDGLTCCEVEDCITGGELNCQVITL
jgi:hypothetical protein